MDTTTTDQHAEGLRSSVDRAWRNGTLSIRRLSGGRDATSVCLLVVIGLIVLPPIGFVVLTSFRTAPIGSPSGAFTGKYWAKLGDASFWHTLWNTVAISGVSTLLAVPVGLAMGWLQATSKSRVTRVLLTVALVPLLFSPLLLTIAWTTLASPRAGLLNTFLRAIHSPVQGVSIYSFWGIVWITTLYMVPLAFLTLRGPIANFDASLIEAARGLGAPPLRTARRVVLPLLRPGIAAAALLVFTLGVGIFPIVTLLGATARVDTLQKDVYFAMAEFPTDPPFAAFAGTVLMLLTLVNMLVYQRIIRNPRRFQMLGGRGSRQLLGAPAANWRLAGGGIKLVVWGYVCLAVAVPYLAMAYGAFTPFLLPGIDLSRLSLANFSRFASDSQMVLGLRNTAILAIGGSVVITLMSLAVAWRVRRARAGRTERLLESVSLAPLAIPHLTLAIGLLWAVLAVPLIRDGLYGTLALIFLSQLAAFLPLGVQIIGSTIIQIGSDVFDAARIAGGRPLQVARMVLVPLLRRTLASAWLILALYSLVEAGMSVFLFTSDSVTTAVNVFMNSQGGNQSVMYAGAFILATGGIVLLAVGEAGFGLTKHLGSRRSMPRE